MAARSDEGYFSAKDNTRLFWRSLMPEAPKAIAGVVHGYGDHSGRYLALMSALAEANIGSVAFDYRGHGKADGRRAHIARFDDYMGDISLFWERVRQTAAGRPAFLFAHSLGGLIATHFALTRPEGLKGLILSAPFYKLALEPSPLKLWGAKMLNVVMPGFHIPTEITVEQLSTDTAWQKSSSEDPLYLDVVTPRWFFETLGAQHALAGRGKDLSVPVLYMGPGADLIASTAAAHAFFDTVASSDKTWRDYPGFRHEGWAETGKAKFFADIVEWISARC